MFNSDVTDNIALVIMWLLISLQKKCKAYYVYDLEKRLTQVKCNGNYPETQCFSLIGWFR